MSAISSAADSRVDAELWYSADEDGGAATLLGSASGTPPPDVGLHLVPWIDDMICVGPLVADGTLLVRLRASAGSANLQVVESELRLP